LGHGAAPGRHCIKELAKKAGNLAKKGVAVVTVHTGPALAEACQKWLKENKITLPVGQVSQDPEAAERQHKAWGVQALPWLSLTDKKHVVLAEGFGLAELDEKIKALSR